MKCSCSSCIGFNRNYVLSLFSLITFMFYFRTWNRQRLLWAADRSDLNCFQIFSSVYASAFSWIEHLISIVTDATESENWFMSQEKHYTLQLCFILFFATHVSIMNSYLQKENSDKEVLNSYFIQKSVCYHFVSIVIVKLSVQSENCNHDSKIILDTLKLIKNDEQTCVGEI